MPENAVEISLAGKYETRTATRGLRLKRAAERASSEEQTALTAEGTPAAVELPVVSEASSHRAAEAAGDADRPARDPEESTEAIRIPGYHIVGRLGRHGMGEVFRARDEQLGREVALKVPRRVTSSLRELFMNEARLLAQVRHEHVVALHAFGTAGDRVYFTMDLIQGWDGAKLIKRARRTRAHRRRGSVLLRALRLSEESLAPDLKAAIGRRRPYYRLVALWIAQAAEGLAAAHEHGILHRDIKPANLLVGGDGRMLLADFGLASPLCKLAQGAAGEPTGTRPYIAPERLVGDTASVDHRSDIWSLGATLYEFLSFRRAFEGGGDDVLSAIATREPTALRAFQRSVPRELERICSRAMRRDPQHRYETASKMADELRRWVERPPARLGRWSIAAVLIASAALAAPRAWPAYWLSSNVRDVGMQQAEVSRKSEAAGSREMRISRGDGLEDRAAHSRPREAAPAAIATPSERLPQPLPSSGVVTQNGSVLLAVNYDLNADDDCPPRTGGTPEAAFRRVCARENVKLAEPIEVPKTWSFPEAMTAAGRCGATVVAFCEINAVSLGQTPRIQGLDFETTRWRLWAELTICRVADGQICRPSPVVLENNPTRPATEQQFGGEELILLSARAAQEALKEARRLATP